MSEISFWLDEYQRETGALTSAVDHLQSLPEKIDPRVATKAVNECETKVNRLKEVKKAYNLEIRLVRDRNMKQETENKFREIDERVCDLIKRYNEAKGRFNKATLMQGSKNIYDVEGKSGDELLAGARVIQDKTFESLGRTRNLIEESKAVGSATLEQLRSQREQMNEIEKEIDVMDSNLARAEKLIVSFTKRMATDKIIQGFAAVNICVLLGLIIYVAVTGKSLTIDQTDDGVPSLGAQPTFAPSPFPTFAPTAAPSI